VLDDGQAGLEEHLQCNAQHMARGA
jgi:hypothetical protein